ncbi:MAG: hypothetical protein JW751_27360 [Polyangiaceae bacterium]|nr:hypothetical protein [Polyangiaceae bacterium]
MTAHEPNRAPPAGQHLDATAEEALELTRAGETDPVSLVGAWIRHGNIGAIAAIADDGVGAARKAARRGLNVLKARGIVPPPRTHVAKVTTRDEVVGEEAHLLAPDSTGSVLLALARRGSSGRTTATFVIVNDPVGVLHVNNEEFAHSKLKERLDRALPNAGYRPVPVPIPWARWRIAQALARQAERRAPEPLGLMTARPLLEPAPSEAPDHPLDAEGLVLAPEDATERAKSSARLHELAEFRAWLPPKPALDTLLLEVGKTLTPDETPPEGHIQHELENQIQAATDRYFSPQVREQLVGLLKDAALSVLAREGEQAALDVIAVIHAVEQAGLITDPPHEVPFLRAFFDKALAIMVAQNKGQLRIPIPQRLPIDGIPTAGAGEGQAAFESGGDVNDAKATPAGMEELDAAWGDAAPSDQADDATGAAKTAAPASPIASEGDQG